MTSSVLASVCLSLGRLRMYDARCVAALEARSRQFLGGCSANQMGQIAEGLCLLGHEPSEEWLDGFVAATGRRWAECGATQLASVASAAARWRAAGRPAGAGVGAGAGEWGGQRGLPGAWLDGFSRAVEREAPGLTPQLLARLLTAAAGMGLRMDDEQPDTHDGHHQHRDDPRVQQQQKQQQQQQRHPSAGRPPSPAAAAAATPAAPPAAAMLRAAVTRLEEALSEFRPRELADCLLALAESRAAPLLAPRARRLILLQLRLQLPLAAGPDVVDSLHALLLLGVSPYATLDSGSGGGGGRSEPSRAPMLDAAQWADMVLVRLFSAMPSLDASRLARLGACLGLLLRRKPYRAWWGEYCGRLRVEAASMAPSDLVICLEGLAEVRLRLDDEVMSRVAAAARCALPVMDSALLKRAASALRAMYGKMRGRKMQDLLEEMERRSSWQM